MTPQGRRWRHRQIWTARLEAFSDDVLALALTPLALALIGSVSRAVFMLHSPHSAPWPRQRPGPPRRGVGTERATGATGNSICAQAGAPV